MTSRPKGFWWKAGVALIIPSAFLMALWPWLREQRSRPVCADNMRRVGQALAMYVEDHDGGWPVESTWRKQQINTTPLAGCPLIGSQKAEGIPGYAYSSALRYGANNTMIAYPATTIAVCEQPVAVMFTSTANPYSEYPLKPGRVEKGWERHVGGAHYLFCDGHVRWLRPEQIATGHEVEMGNGGVTPSFALASKDALRRASIRQWGTGPK